jgi:hypothetical protein
MKFLIKLSPFFLLLCSGGALAQEGQKQESAAVIELGAAPSLSVTDRRASIGPTLAVEVSPIEKWLELEAGVTPSFTRHSTEWATDLLFKKPWTLSRKVEFMAGIGPEWIHSGSAGVTRDSAAAEAALDFMFWPGRNRKFGWYLEPAYEYDFGPGHEKSIGMSVGLLIAIGKR